MGEFTDPAWTAGCNVAEAIRRLTHRAGMVWSSGQAIRELVHHLTFSGPTPDVPAMLDLAYRVGCVDDLVIARSMIWSALCGCRIDLVEAGRQLERASS